MNEHYYIENEQFPKRIYDSTDVGQFKKQLRAAHPFLGTIMDHANAAKHVKERKGLPSFENTNVRQKINVSGVMRCGWPLDSRPYLLDSPELNFLVVDVVKCAEEFWAGRFGDPTD